MCHFRAPSLLGLAALLLLCGCSDRGRPGNKEPDLPAWLSDDTPTPGGTNSEILFANDAPVSLGLALKPGDQFPLRKVVEQELQQDTVQGTPQTNRSRLELMFAITVLEQREGRTKLGVRYSRVRYSHDVAGEHVEYDSTRPTAELPLSVLAYHDMVNDGFAFWLGPDNQILEVDGLTEFLNRCLARVPEDQRQNVVLGMEAGSGETGIANFVDNSIGLLPCGTQSRPGDSWDRQQHVSRPIPMHINNRYTLKELSNNLAVIDIRGAITPSTTVNMLDDGNGVRVLVNGGETLGSCSIYRDTGLPKESRVDRTIDMTVVLSSAISFRQRKRIMTSIESFPANNMAGGNSGIMQTSGTYPTRPQEQATASTQMSAIEPDWARR
ncbi:DUF6263 family protein [Planctomicrobium sp. SH664]|uniref:DUF6263 family protein n=1 Tax=Planctomicrobium sp. SH664 TaxID=3448125 RepID=UPI003F5B4AFC